MHGEPVFEAYAQNKTPGAYKGKTIVAYCGNMLCGLAPKAALLLAEKGYPVMTLAGGIATWQEKGFPLEK